MSNTIRSLVDEAKERLRSLELVQEKYPDAIEGSILDTPIIASSKALADAKELLVFSSGKDVVVLPAVRVGEPELAVVGWTGGYLGLPIEVLFERFRSREPAAYQKLVEQLRG
jgi:hypothetical protein